MDRRPRNGRTIKEAAEVTGLSERSIRRWTSTPREQWLAEKAAEREAIRAFHDDEGHSWPETAKHFGLHYDTVKRRAGRARKERAAERAMLDMNEDLLGNQTVGDPRLDSCLGASLD